jgi:site-specific recombinase XerD
LAKFADWCVQHGRKPLDANAGDLDSFRDDSLHAGASAATVSRRLSALGSFYRFAASVEVLDTNPVDAVARPDGEAAPPDTLDDDELLLLVGAAESLGVKTAALVSMLALDGLKLGEVLTIDVPRVKIDAGVMTIQVQRRGHTEVVRVAPRTAAAVAAYLGARRRGPLFVGDSPAAKRPRLSRFGADFLVKKAGATAGIDKPVSASILRRSYIASARRAGTSLADIAHHVGHRSARDTARLLEGVE